MNSQVIKRLSNTQNDVQLIKMALKYFKRCKNENKNSKIMKISIYSKVEYFMLQKNAIKMR